MLLEPLEPVREQLHAVSDPLELQRTLCLASLQASHYLQEHPHVPVAL